MIRCNKKIKFREVATGINRRYCVVHTAFTLLEYLTRKKTAANATRTVRCENLENITLQK